MNIFIIPSWYPSSDYPLSGIFTKEQVLSLAKNYPSHNFCISLWGQKEESNLLSGKDHLFNILKVIKFLNQSKKSKKLTENVSECYTPALTWTKKILSGNIKRIINSNEDNLKWFEQKFGKADIIHAHSAYPGGYVAFALSQKSGLPYIITEHITPFPSKYYLNKKGQFNAGIWKTLLNAEHLIAVSSSLHAKFTSLALKNSVYIPNLTDESFFELKKDTYKHKQVTLFMLGRMVHQKGVSVLLRAIAKEKNNNAIFRIGGDGEELEQYKQFAEKLELDNVVWLGRLTREEVKDELQRCQAFILPSLHENLPLVLLEAIACGKPIIVTNCGGPESIVNKNNGLLAKVGDVRDLADKINWMVENHRTYNPKIIRDDFLTRFASKVVGSQIIELYKKVTNN